MTDAASSSTPPTLLHRLRHHPTDEAAWEQFVDRYGKQIYSWCRRWGLQDADAHDVTQTVLLKVARRMQTFEYDRQQSFRAWLQTVTRHALQDFQQRRPGNRSRRPLRRRCRPCSGWSRARTCWLGWSASSTWNCWRRLKLRVRLRVQSQTWQAYLLTAEQGLSALETAQKLGTTLTAVYAAKSHVLKMLQEEIAALSEAGT